MPPLLSNRPNSLAEAQEIVARISDDHGYISEDILSSMTAVQRRAVVGAMLKKDGMIGSSVITLAKNLYSSSARFVFELLQNADDNDYTRAKSSGIEPYVSFEIVSDKIVMECNEDGFTKENLIAICDVGKSSKSGAQGYIGEKGIGFKSVFMAAYKVHIQSGTFSFSFTHRHGDSGMGMISPVWEHPDAQLSRNITRVTLHLHDSGSASDMDGRLEQIVQQFREIQGTHLLFLRKIRRIHIKFSIGDKGEQSKTTFEAANSQLGGRVTLHKVVNGNLLEKAQYHVTRHTAQGLPKSENRNTMGSEHTASALYTAEVILAFPLNNESPPAPFIKTQQIYAFLPIRDMGFKFLIHTDFVTQATRQDIVTTSPRNKALVPHIATAFSKAMEQLCQDEALQFQWMKYLPQEDDYPWDEYWKELIASMKKSIASVNLMYPRNGGSLKTTAQVRYLTDFGRDENGAPLFADIAPEIYLSEKYTCNPLIYLRHWGLKVPYMQEFLDRVEADLSQKTSRLKSPLSSQRWHSNAAKLISYPFEREWTSEITKVRLLKVIPLEDGRWISSRPSSRPIVFPRANGVRIPRDLELNIIAEAAIENVERVKLFEQLDAQTLKTSRVREMILSKYPSVFNKERAFGSTGKVDEISRSHLTFLYQTHDSSHRDEYRWIRVLTETQQLLSPQSQDVYLSSNHKYGVKHLLEDIPKFPVAFLSSVYLDKPPECLDGKTPKIAWKHWLESSLGLQSRPKLIANGAFTDFFRHLVNHRSCDLVGILQHYWSDISETVQGSQKIRDEIADIVIESGDRSLSLKHWFLPTKELETRASEYLEGKCNARFPFLDLSSTMEPTDLSKWGFLHDAFGVGMHENTKFYITLLEIIRDQHRSPNVEISIKVYSLYERILLKTRESSDAETRRRNQEEIRIGFEDRDQVLLLPGRDSCQWCWAYPIKCRWDAPSTMTSCYPVKYRFDHTLKSNEIGGRLLEQFLRDILSIKDCTWQDLVRELVILSSKNSAEAPTEIYTHLSKLAPKLSVTERERLMNNFKEKSLIFASKSWHTTDDCLWSTATNIDGKTSLNENYPDLEKFFTSVLGVKTLTAQMVYEKLILMGESGGSSIGHVKDTWKIFNSLLSQTGNKPDPTPILEARLFPVEHPDGQVDLCTVSTPFALKDQKIFVRYFSGKANFLNFDFEETLELQETFEWAGLNVRSLKISVNEVSRMMTASQLPISSSDRDLAPKAHGLCRIARHCKSPRAKSEPEALYALLQKAQVWETDCISSRLQLQQGDRLIEVESQRSDLHVAEEEDSIQVYVPRDSGLQQKCYVQNLPKLLHKWMMSEQYSNVPTRDSERCINLLKSILTLPHGLIGETLDEEGVTELSFLDEYQSASEGDAQIDRATVPRTPGRQTGSRASDHGGRVPALHGDADASLFDSEGETYVEEVETPATSLFPTPSSGIWRARDSVSPVRMPRQHSSNDTSSYFISRRNLASSALDTFSVGADYVTLLSKVIHIARGSSLPRKDSFDITRLRRAISDLDTPDEAPVGTSFYASSPLERDRMVGAAGELYVFELLSRMNPRLPRFSRDNWQSTIRKYVGKHPEYADMNPWNGRETADIVYKDASGVLTSTLIDHGYLDEDRWAERRPEYLIEVKTTTGPCETPFFMSKGQYKRMREKSTLTLPEASADIYVVFRVSKLAQESMDVAIYVDPEYMRQNQSLVFTPETYSVTPGSGLGFVGTTGLSDNGI
ncbi:uncharacterized protein JN550_011802 [Neoarthrinium moseri]|uniref:uncharacterized protein n=1 Tax=Neoarthrinium moseri TaxID=1658444 RepID=UPI001FDB42DA|nr:uncharacterized protein JN550_011802 [Neoarthrinium moseri]KAI1859883.1 hypothetical protein JN550_011802 [Neoarthrinium moseri]